MRMKSLCVAILGSLGVTTVAAEEPKHTVLKKDKEYEIRRYEPYIVAETTVDGLDHDEASNEGFRRLAGYIFGGNTVRQKIDMTAPVTTEMSRKIEMTAPVTSERKGGSFRVTFMMPSEFTMESLPVPNDARVTLTEVPARTLAAISFSGRWTDENFQEHAEALRVWISTQGLKVAGDPIIARYNPPFVPSFFRRNEILIPVESAGL
jgi:hypothetical protein